MSASPAAAEKRPHPESETSQEEPAAKRPHTDSENAKKEPTAEPKKSAKLYVPATREQLDSMGALVDHVFETTRAGDFDDPIHSASEVAEGVPVEAVPLAPLRSNLPTLEKLIADSTDLTDGQKEDLRRSLTGNVPELSVPKEKDAFYYIKVTRHQIENAASAIKVGSYDGFGMGDDDDADAANAVVDAEPENVVGRTAALDEALRKAISVLVGPELEKFGKIIAEEYFGEN